jgi:hypothetical protein
VVHGREGVGQLADTRVSLRQYVLALLRREREAREAADKRYEQRFIAQEGAVQSALTAQEKAVNAALIAADRAVAKAEVAAEKRFDSTNEFRGQLRDQQLTFPSKAEVEQRFLALLERVGKVEERLTRAEGNGAGRATTMAWVVTAVTVALGVGGLLLSVFMGRSG